MSLLVSRAESRLSAYVEQLQEVFFAIESSLPESSLEDLGADVESLLINDRKEGKAEVPETLQQQLEWEEKEEKGRLALPLKVLQGRFQELKQSIVGLGGGTTVNDIGQPVLIDIPLEMLDKDIECLTAESIYLGDLLLAKYSEVEAAAGEIERRIMQAL